MKRKLTWRQRLFCLLTATEALNFWRDFPAEDTPGPWVAEALTESRFIGLQVKRERLVKTGKFDAYITARRLAINLSRVYYDEELGIRWRVRRPRDDE